MLTMARPRKLTEDQRLRKRTDGIWEVVWTDINDPKRPTHRKSTGTRDRQEAETLFPQIVADTKIVKPPANETVGWVIETYLADKEREKTPKQFAPIKAALTPIKDRLGGLRPDQLLQPVIDGYVDWRRAQVRWTNHPKMKAKVEKTVSDSSIGKELRLLRASLNHMGATYGRRDLAPVFNIKVSDALPRDEYLTRDEVQRMLNKCGEGREHIELFLLISVATGARKEAVLSLRWDQVHIGAERAGVGESGRYHDGTWIDFGPGSGNKRRPKIPVTNNMRLWTLLTPIERPHPEYVITYRGKPIEEIKDGFANVLSDASVRGKKVTPHNMKHTAITLMLQRGIDVDTVAMWTNTTPEIIRRVYGHHIPDHHKALGDAVSF